MKREDATFLIRAVLIGLSGILALGLSSLLVAFVYHARRVEAEGLYGGHLHHLAPPRALHRPAGR